MLGRYKLGIQNRAHSTTGEKMERNVRVGLAQLEIALNRAATPGGFESRDIAVDPAYQQLRAANNIANENIETAEMYQDAAMQWGAWGGWGAGWGPMGMGVGVGRFR